MNDRFLKRESMRSAQRPSPPGPVSSQGVWYYYGVNFFWQGSRNVPACGRDEFDELWVTEHFVTLLTALFFAVSGAIDTLAAVHLLAGHSQLQDELSNELSALVEQMGGNSSQDDEHDFRTEQA